MTKSDSNVRQDHFIQNAVQQLFSGCAPERELELRDHWNNLAPVFQMVGDVHETERFILDAGAYRYVRFNHRATRAFWLGAFAAWESYRAVAESEDICVVDLAKLKEFIEAFDRTLMNDQSDNEPLPQGVPEPGTFPDAATFPQERAAAELATVALGWALLHEVRHIQHQQAGTSADPHGIDPQPARNEELSCDAFATEFLLENIQKYAQMKSEDALLVRRKRETGIYFALFTLTLLTKDNWGASKTHPAVQDRIDAVVTLMGAQHDEIAKAIAHTAFAALRTLWPTAPGVAMYCP